MKFFVILFCLVLERFFPLEKFLKREKAYHYYFKQVTQLAPEEWQQGNYGLFVFLLPILLVVFLFDFFANHYFSKLSVFLVESLTLLYCLGPISVYHLHASIPQNVFEKIQDGLFSVLFWFAVLGPLGSLLYRLVERMALIPTQPLPLLIKPHIASMAQPLLGYLAWLPIRLFSAIRAIVSRSSNMFNYWLDHFLSGWEYNNQFIKETNHIVLPTLKEDSMESEEYIHTLELVDRILIVFLGMILMPLLLRIIFHVFRF